MSLAFGVGFQRVEDMVQRHMHQIRGQHRRRLSYKMELWEKIDGCLDS